MPGHFDTDDAGYGMLYSHNREGKIIACKTIIGLCAGCKKPIVIAPSTHAGPSGGGRVVQWKMVGQEEMERMERLKFDTATRK